MSCRFEYFANVHDGPILTQSLHCPFTRVRRNTFAFIGVADILALSGLSPKSVFKSRVRKFGLCAALSELNGCSSKN